MKVIVDQARCQGHGRCYDLAPDVFDSDERGHVALSVHADLPALLEADARIGVLNCPETALRFGGRAAGLRRAAG